MSKIKNLMERLPLKFNVNSGPASSLDYWTSQNRIGIANELISNKEYDWNMH